MSIASSLTNLRSITKAILWLVAIGVGVSGMLISTAGAQTTSSGSSQAGITQYPSFEAQWSQDGGRQNVEYGAANDLTQEEREARCDSFIEQWPNLEWTCFVYGDPFREYAPAGDITQYPSFEAQWSQDGGRQDVEYGAADDLTQDEAEARCDSFIEQWPNLGWKCYYYGDVFTEYEPTADEVEDSGSANDNDNTTAAFSATWEVLESNRTGEYGQTDGLTRAEAVERCDEYTTRWDYLAWECYWDGELIDEYKPDSDEQDEEENDNDSNENVNDLQDQIDNLIEQVEAHNGDVSEVDTEDKTEQELQAIINDLIEQIEAANGETDEAAFYSVWRTANGDNTNEYGRADNLSRNEALERCSGFIEQWNSLVWRCYWDGDLIRSHSPNNNSGNVAYVRTAATSPDQDTILLSNNDETNQHVLTIELDAQQSDDVVSIESLGIDAYFDFDDEAVRIDGAALYMEDSELYGEADIERESDEDYQLNFELYNDVRVEAGETGLLYLAVTFSEAPQDFSEAEVEFDVWGPNVDMNVESEVEVEGVEHELRIDDAEDEANDDEAAFSATWRRVEDGQTGTYGQTNGLTRAEALERCDEYITRWDHLAWECYWDGELIDEYRPNEENQDEEAEETGFWHMDSNDHMYVVGVYQGSYPDGTERGFQEHPQGEIVLNMNRQAGQSTDTMLVLTSYEPVEWKLQGDVTEYVSRVFLSGYYDQEITGIDDDTEVVHMSHESGDEQYFHFNEWKSDNTTELNEFLEEKHQLKRDIPIMPIIVRTRSILVKRDKVGQSQTEKVESTPLDLFCMRRVVAQPDLNYIEAYLVYTYGSSLESEVLKVGHHGSKTSTAKEFLSAVQAEFAVISAGADNSYGHPHEVVMQRLRAADLELSETADLGTITFISDGTSVRQR